jgi:hypothetical protein
MGLPLPLRAILRTVMWNPFKVAGENKKEAGNILPLSEHHHSAFTEAFSAAGAFAFNIFVTASDA